MRNEDEMEKIYRNSPSYKIKAELLKAGFEDNDKTDRIIDDICNFKLVRDRAAGTAVSKLDDKSSGAIRELFGGKDGSFNVDIEKICKIAIGDVENLQLFFGPIISEYKEEKQFKETLDMVQEAVVGLGNNEQTKKQKGVVGLVNDQVKNQMGEANAEMLNGIVQKMKDRLEGVVDQSKRAEILTEGIKEMQKFVENAEKQAGKGEFGKVMNVLKSALKVVGTLGLDKT